MEYETLSVLSIETKLPLLEKLLDRRIDRASVDMVSPTLPLLEKVRKFGEYKRLAANLAVMAHRIACELGKEAQFLVNAVRSKNNGLLTSKRGRAASAAARSVLRRLGVKSLEAYRELPLFAAECKRIKRLLESSHEKPMPLPMQAGYASV